MGEYRAHDSLVFFVLLFFLVLPGHGISILVLPGEDRAGLKLI